MKGTFKGWLSGKCFGFIEVDGLSHDTFLHQDAVKEPQALEAGSVVEFEAIQPHIINQT